MRLSTPLLTLLLFSLSVAALAQDASPLQRRWSHGSPFGPDYFPIGVWLQSPENAEKYRDAGINLYVGLWQGPTEDQLAQLKAAHMPVICDQNAVGLAHKDDPTIVGWLQQDEPDNAQPVKDPQTGKEGYGPPVPPSRIIDLYHEMHQNDPTRPVLLNLGQGVTNEEWVGHGSGFKMESYLDYVKGGDIISFDIYPIAGLEKPHPEDYLWYVPRGVDRLVQWTGGKKLVWCYVECTHIGDANRQPTPHQVRAEAWMALIHGANGLLWFVHQFQPKFDEHALLDDPVMLPAVTALNHRVESLAPVLNSPTLEGVGTVQAGGDSPVDILVKRHAGALYIFAVGMRNAPAKATFQLKGLPPDASAEVLDEGRKVSIQHGHFTDSFAPYDVHLYRIPLR